MLCLLLSFVDATLRSSPPTWVNNVFVVGEMNYLHPLYQLGKIVADPSLYQRRTLALCLCKCRTLAPRPCQYRTLAPCLCQCRILAPCLCKCQAFAPRPCQCRTLAPRPCQCRTLALCRTLTTLPLTPNMTINPVLTLVNGLNQRKYQRQLDETQSDFNYAIVEINTF